MNTAQKISEITRKHLKKGGVALGQCLTAVGWVGGTVPELTENDGLIELSIADSSNSGIAVGLALAGRRPIYIVRYQGFQWYNAVSIVNYAAKSKALWNTPCPVFVRSLAADGGAGPIHGGSHHSLFTRMPGISVCAPMTPGEYEKVWKYYMEHDDPIYVSEHRSSFPIDYEMEDELSPKADITLLAISSTRLNAVKAKKLLADEGITANIIHLLWLKPFTATDEMISAIKSSEYGGLVLDGEIPGGAMSSIALELSQKTGSLINVLGLDDRTTGFAPQYDNLPPMPEKIQKKVKEIISEKK